MARRFLFLLLPLPLAVLTAWASPQDDSYTRMARLSYIEGHVSFQHASEVDWSAASVNLPLEPGDRIYTGQDGRAEIEFDDGSVCRLAEDSDFEILSLEQELIEVRLLVGLSTLTVSGEADFQIHSPVAAFKPTRSGVYRFDVVENGDTDAIVRKGELEADSDKFSRRVESGELLHVPEGEGSPELSQYDQRDLWDEWNDRRDADLNAYESTRYLPDTASMGASDLDRYGRWVDVDSYGAAWVPFAADTYWAPYSIGRWCYRPLFGWTWVSYEPWGWLPYHYGRWYHSASFGWCWLPGPAFAFNFWSPGLVAFYRGPGWISWCPLGPGDYYPINLYRFNRGVYGHQLSWVQALGTREPGNLFNRDARGAFRIAQVEQFQNGSFNNGYRNARWGDIEQPWRQGTLVPDRLGVEPTSASFSAAPDRPAVQPMAPRAPSLAGRTYSSEYGTLWRYERTAPDPGATAYADTGPRAGEQRQNSYTETPSGDGGGWSRAPLSGTGRIYIIPWPPSPSPESGGIYAAPFYHTNSGSSGRRSGEGRGASGRGSSGGGHGHR